MEIGNPSAKNQATPSRFTPATEKGAGSSYAGTTPSKIADRLAQASFSPIEVSSSSLLSPLSPMAHSGSGHVRAATPGATTATANAKRPIADRVGIWLSFLCVIHCLATPVLLIVFPALEAMKIARIHEGFHLALLLILPVVAVIAFIPGYRRHQNREVFYWALPGLLIIAYVALWFEEASWFATAISVTGSLFLIRAHVVNRRLCACCHPPR